MNEAAALEDVERERAKRRQAEQAKLNQPQAKKESQKVTTLSPSENPMAKAWADDQQRQQVKAKTRESIGQRVSIGARTTNKALKVKAAVDTLKGKTH